MDLKRCALLLCLTVGCLASCSQNQRKESPPISPTPVSGGEFRLALDLADSLDPIHSDNYSESALVLQLFDSLLQFDENLNLMPGLARDWRVLPDGRTYLFSLREGVRFHNGRNVTAADVVYSLTRLLDPQWKSPDAAHYLVIQGARPFHSGKSKMIEGIQALGPTKIQIRLEHPFAPFLSLLALQVASIVPAEEVRKSGMRFGRQPVGTGAFRFLAWEKPGEILMEANPDYYQGAPYLKTVRVRTLPALSASDNFELFKQGLVDVSFLPSQERTQVNTRRDWMTLSTPVLRLVYLGLNFRTPLMQRLEIRQAIMRSVDPERLTGSASEYHPAYSLIPFSLLGSSPSSYLPMQAIRSKLNSAPELRQISHLHPVLTLCYATPPSAVRQAMMRQLVKELEKGGFRVQCRVAASLPELTHLVRTGRVHLFVLGEILDFPDPHALLYRLFYSSSDGNIFAYHNRQVDELLMEAQQSLDEERRAELYRQIEQLILSDSAVVPLFSTNYSLVWRQKVHGLQVTPLGYQHFPLRKVWIEP